MNKDKKENRSFLHAILMLIRTPEYITTLIARFMGPTWGLPGADRTQVGPMWATWTLLSGHIIIWRFCDILHLIIYIGLYRACYFASIIIAIGFLSLQWRHNERDGVSNYQPHDCLFNRLFRRRSKKTSKLRVTGLFRGAFTGDRWFPTQRASNAENVSIWWRHHVMQSFGVNRLPKSFQPVRGLYAF